MECIKIKEEPIDIVGGCSLEMRVDDTINVRYEECVCNSHKSGSGDLFDSSNCDLHGFSDNVKPENPCPDGIDCKGLVADAHVKQEYHSPVGINYTGVSHAHINDEVKLEEPCTGNNDNRIEESLVIANPKEPCKCDRDYNEEVTLKQIQLPGFAH